MREYLAMLQGPKDSGYVVPDVGGQREGFSGPGPGKSQSYCSRSLSGCEIFPAYDYSSCDFPGAQVLLDLFSAGWFPAGFPAGSVTDLVVSPK